MAGLEARSDAVPVAHRSASWNNKPWNNNWNNKLNTWALALTLIAGLGAGLAPAAHAQTYTTLYSFNGIPDGAAPTAPLVRDAAGNLYGTTVGGGISSGTVFEISSTGTETILHTFQGKPDGSSPWGGLVRDAAGDFYGTTAYGGAYNFGTVFKITKAGKYGVLYSFTGVPDGATPFTGLTIDFAGNLYGVTLFGGTGNCTSESGDKGCGTVFMLSAAGTETVLHNFAGGADGEYPGSPLVRDSAGNFYGATENGGATSCLDYSGYGCGTIFKLSNTGVETILHSFSGPPSDGEVAEGVIIGPKGNLYGTTLGGGPHGYGTVFELTPAGTETLLYSFGASPHDGRNPSAGLVGNAAGDFYGTTEAGGGQGCVRNGCGTIFELTRSGREKMLYSFYTNNGGCVPFAGLIRDSAGNLYGTTTNCGTTGSGTVFKLTP
jgi:uncharacterized repeat protein (TIGR03803 family)